MFHLDFFRSGCMHRYILLQTYTNLKSIASASVLHSFQNGQGPARNANAKIFVFICKPNLGPSIAGAEKQEEEP